MDYCCEQCGHREFDIEYDRFLVCKNCFHDITWLRAVEEIFGSNGLRIDKDKSNNYDVSTKEDPHTKLARVIFSIGKDVNTILMESYSYEHIAQILDLLKIFRVIFEDLRLILSVPDKDAGVCPVCKSKLSHKLVCNKKGHFYNLSSTTLLSSIVLQQAHIADKKVETLEPHYKRVRVIVDGDSFEMEFREHYKEELLAISKKATQYFPEILEAVKIFEKTASGKVQRIVTVDI